MTGSKGIGGALILYSVTSIWTFFRANLSLQYEDVKAFHQSLEKLLENRPILSKNIPVLPDPQLFNITSKVKDSQGELIFLI